ncbi:hypothetical protein ACKWTF_013114 [Chironomus riparius]
MSHKAKASPKPSPKNTLFNYFARNSLNTSQNVEKTAEKESPVVKKEVQGNLTGKKLDFGKRGNSSDEEDIKVNKSSKKRKIIDSDDEDTENSDSNTKKEVTQASKKRLIDSDDEMPPPKNPISRLAKFSEDAAPESPSSKKSKSEKQDLTKLVPKNEPEDEDDESQGFSLDTEQKIYTHESFEFLQPENIRDMNKNRPNHPNYDPRTLHIPESFLKQQTPGHLQWWKLKAQYYDCIFFFKVGKFYELYHQDAVTGVKELGLTFMKGDYAHSGFPETAYDKMSSTLVERGYKVARIEQVETPAMMEKRCEAENKRTKFDKVVKREICQVTNVGMQNNATGLFSMAKSQFSANPNFLLCIAEKKIEKSNNTRYGIAFVDSSIGDFMIGEFEDDDQCSRLLTLLSLYTPVLILHDRTGMGENTSKVLKGINVVKEKLTNEKQFWNGSKALNYLAETTYKNENDWPECLKEMQSDHLKPSEDCTLALKALGGCLWYLKYNLLDQQVLSLATFKRYVPPDQKIEFDGSKIKKENRKQTHMMLDAITLHNLNVNGDENSLIMKLDYCNTQFGKRLLKEIVCMPSCEIDEIKARQEAVNELKENVELLNDCRGLLSSLNVDVERSLSQIHHLGNKDILQNHPQSKAILYEAETYGKNKIIDFAAALDAFNHLMSLPKVFKNCTSSMLKMLTQTKENGGNFIDLSPQLSLLQKSFNIEEAKKSGYIIPGRNADEEYDAVLDEIDTLETELKVYLKQQEKVVGCKLNYFGSDRKRYQMEVPESHFKKVPKVWNLENSKGKGKNAVNRYTSDETKEFLTRMQELEAKKKNVLNDFGRRIFEKFSKNYVQFKQIVNLTAKLDVIASFAEFSRNLDVSCIPEVFEMAENPGESLLTIENGVHPLMNCDDYIANGVTIGKDGAFFELITGPNMGGKSTLMRQVALLSMLAQIGTLVPAESMSLTLIDRIFTRLGANDNIMKNQSTFLVELNETAIILKHCTSNSLILLDELGRGTSTFDGSAIARAVSNFIADMKCRTLFSTHYHSLVDDFQEDNRIKLGHMACVVENENSEDITKENVTFLYKYVGGSCPRSFGFNAAKLAGIDHEIIRRAHEVCP